MKAIDLIIKLQQLPQNMEVLFISEPKNSEHFKGEGIEDADEIELPDGTKYVGLFSGAPDYDINDN